MAMGREAMVPEKWQHLRPRTIEVLRGDDFYDPREDLYGAVAPPQEGLTGLIYTSIAYVSRTVREAAEVFAGVRSGYAYSRISSTPPIDALSRKLIEMEVGKDSTDRDEFGVLLTSSGMSAIFLVVLSLAEETGEFISSPYLYGGTHHLFCDRLPKRKMHCHMVGNPFSVSAWERAAASHPNASFLFAEDDANPTPFKLDNAVIAAVAHRYGMLYICDRTVGTPILEQPLRLGADVVIHSCSKNIGGRSQALGGAIIARREIIKTIHDKWFTVVGAVMDARVADYMLYGIRDLEERMGEKQRNARRVAEFLRDHPCVKKVYGPGGDLLAFETAGSFENAVRVVESYRLILLAPHLGHIRTLSIHPASTTHAQIAAEERSKLGISDTLIRISVGLEDPEDVIDDLDQALIYAFSA